MAVLGSQKNHRPLWGPSWYIIFTKLQKSSNLLAESIRTLHGLHVVFPREKLCFYHIKKSYPSACFGYSGGSRLVFVCGQSNQNGQILVRSQADRRTTIESEKLRSSIVSAQNFIEILQNKNPRNLELSLWVGLVSWSARRKVDKSVGPP